MEKPYHPDTDRNFEKIMNILMVSMDYPPVPGGISAHVYELAKSMSKSGHTVSVLTRGKKGEPRKSVSEGISVYRVTLNYAAFVYGIQIRNCIREILPETKPNVIHIHGMGPLEWYNIRKIPLVYTNHTSGYLKRVQKGGFRRMALLKRLFKKPDLFLAPSKELLHTPFEIRAQKQFIPNGVDQTKYRFNSVARDEKRNELSIGENEQVAIITRRLVEKNGVIYLARAVPHIDNTGLRFIVIGDGPERKKIENEFRKNCGDRVVFTGNKPHDEIIDYYSAADFSILPSLMEATSISGLEAMSSGLPIVGTRVGGIPELIKNGENGYLCNPADPHDLADKINLLLAGNMKALGANSRRMVENEFSWSRIGEKTIDSYEMIL